MRQTLKAIRYLESEVSRAEGLEGIVLRYGSLYGAEAMDGYSELVRKRKLPIVGDGAGVWSFLHTDDAAAATLAAIDHGRPGTFNVVDDDPAAASEWIPYLAGLVGARPPRRVPVWLARIAAGEVAVSMMTQIRGSSNQKAKRELAWEPRYGTWRDGFRAALGDASAAPAAPPPRRPTPSPARRGSG